MGVKKLSLFTIICFLLLCCNKNNLKEAAGLKALNSWSNLPVLHNYGYQQFSSYDRERKLDYPLAGPKNKDFNNFLAACGDRPQIIYQEIDDQKLCDNGIDGYLLAKVDNRSGFVSRIWTTSLAGFNDDVFKIYADNLSKPAYTTTISDWEFDFDQIFKLPLAGKHSGAWISYVPVSFNNSLRVLLDNLSEVNVYYYHVDIQYIDTSTSSFKPENFTDENLKKTIKLLSNYSNHEIPDEPTLILNNFQLKNETQSKIFEINQPGTIKKFSLSLKNISLSHLKNIYLKIRWDFLPDYSVNAPLSAFFGCQLNILEFRTLPFDIAKNGDTLLLSSFFPMPFNSNAEIFLENLNKEDIMISSDIIISPVLPESEWGYFHATYNEVTAPVPENTLYPVTKISGKGKYVGTFMFMEGHRDENSAISHPLNFLEGDEIGIIDGELKIHGTGTEDYFNAGFYFLDGEYNYAFSGMNYKWSDDYSGKVSAYRWHVLTDEINFNESFELNFEYGADVPQIADRYASVGYYYLKK